MFNSARGRLTSLMMMTGCARDGAEPEALTPRRSPWQALTQTPSAFSSVGPLIGRPSLSPRGHHRHNTPEQRFGAQQRLDASRFPLERFTSADSGGSRVLTGRSYSLAHPLAADRDAGGSSGARPGPARTGMPRLDLGRVQRAEEGQKTPRNVGAFNRQHTEPTPRMADGTRLEQGWAAPGPGNPWAGRQVLVGLERGGHRDGPSRNQVGRCTSESALGCDALRITEPGQSARFSD